MRFIWKVGLSDDDMRYVMAAKMMDWDMWLCANIHFAHIIWLDQSGLQCICVGSISFTLGAISSGAGHL